VQLPGRFAPDGLVGEEAGVDGEVQRGVEPVGGHLHVREVGQGQRPLGRRRTSLQVGAGRGHSGGGAVGIAPVELGAGGEGAGPGVPAGGAGVPEGALDGGELGAEGPGVPGVAGREQPPAGRVELRLDDGLGPGGHGILQSADGLRIRCGAGR
jgi:hypothetical protein